MNDEQVIYTMMLVAVVSAALAAWIFYKIGKQDGRSEALAVSDPYQFLQTDYLKASQRCYVVRKDFKLGYLIALNRYMSTQGKAAAGYEADAEAFDKS